MRNILDLLACLHPRFWLMNDLYSKEWDALFNRAMELNKFEFHSPYYAKLGDLLVWVENYPYACFTSPYGPFRPSRKTIYRAFKKYKEDVLMVHKTGCPTSKPLVARDLIDWNKLDKDIKEWESTTKYVIQDMKAREAFGLQKYGKSLTVNTDEDMLQHLYEELLDSAVYIKTLIMQRQSR